MPDDPRNEDMRPIPDATPEHGERSTAPQLPATPAPLARRWGWDFSLMVATVALLAALGAQSLAGTVYVWWAQRSAEGWLESPAYESYVSLMNTIAAPLLAALVVALGLCVPKRLFAHRTLLAVSAAMVGLGVVVGALSRSLAAGLTVYLVAAALLQLVVVAMTFARSAEVVFLTEGRYRRVGSGLLHLGFIMSCVVVVALQDYTGWMLIAFFIAAALLTVGSAMSFYSRR